MISCFFATGTGRCGTDLMSRVLNLDDSVVCHHEHSVDTIKMKKSFFKSDINIINRDANRLLYPEVKEVNMDGKMYGEVSGHLYLLFREMFRKYEFATRFILLVRKPETFIPSALARGFFDPTHPYPCEHVVPPRDTAIGENWKKISPFEKCAWYWAMVNSTVYSFFNSLPEAMYRIVRIEDLSLSLVSDLYEFLGIPNFDMHRLEVENLLGQRRNSSPGLEAGSFDNPKSCKIYLGNYWEWEQWQRDVFLRHAFVMREALYGEGAPVATPE